MWVLEVDWNDFLEILLSTDDRLVPRSFPFLEALHSSQGKARHPCGYTLDSDSFAGIVL